MKEGGRERRGKAKERKREIKKEEKGESF